MRFAALADDEPASRRRPHLDRGAAADLYGEAASGWSLAGGKLTVSVTVPPNARGTVRLPGAAWPR